MKWIFSIFIFFTLDVNARSLIVLSGDFENKISSIEKVITSSLGLPSKYLLTEVNNKKCILRSDAVIQFCFKGLNYKIVHKKEKLLKRTLGRLISLNTKGPQVRGPRNHK